MWEALTNLGGQIGSGLANLGTAAWDGLKGVGDFAGFDGKFGFDGTWGSAAEQAGAMGAGAYPTDAVAQTVGQGLAATKQIPWTEQLLKYGPAALGAYSQYNQSQAAGELADLKKQEFIDEKTLKAKNAAAIRSAFGGTPSTGYSMTPTTTSI